MFSFSFEALFLIFLPKRVTPTDLKSSMLSLRSLTDVFIRETTRSIPQPRVSYKHLKRTPPKRSNSFPSEYFLQYN